MAPDHVPPPDFQLTPPDSHPVAQVGLPLSHEVFAGENICWSYISVKVSDVNSAAQLLSDHGRTCNRLHEQVSDPPAATAAHIAPLLLQRTRWRERCGRWLRVCGLSLMGTWASHMLAVEARLQAGGRHRPEAANPADQAQAARRAKEDGSRCQVRRALPSPLALRRDR